MQDKQIRINQSQLVWLTQSKEKEMRNPVDTIFFG